MLVKVIVGESVGGERREMRVELDRAGSPPTLSDLARELHLDGPAEEGALTVFVNGAVVPARERQGRVLREGDEVAWLRMVAGG